MIIWGGSGTASGGRYVLGHQFDDDGDGLSECAGDCNDRTPASRPGAGELCDGLDNDCDGAVDNVPLPEATTSLEAAQSGAKSNLAWSPAIDATGYDVVRGDLLTLTGNGGDFTGVTLACLADDLPATMITLDDAPPPGGGSWYLIRATNCAGAGSYDAGGPGQLRSRDPGIDASGFACP